MILYNIYIIGDLYIAPDEEDIKLFILVQTLT